ncbi:MAG: methyltransferase domain-containing protein [bacterium]
METPAQHCLIKQLIRVLQKEKEDTPRILNIGAGKNLFIENHLIHAGCNYICDRVDINDCALVHPCVDKCWQCSIESMFPVESNKYLAVFASYVLEHIIDLNKTSREIYRVLKPSGIFVASIPNPTAPEFILSKLTPLWFHKMVRGEESWKTYYTYSSIRKLVKIFESAGLRLINIKYYSFVELYLHRFVLLDILGRFYDKIISTMNIKKLMGNVCVTFEKSS